MEDYNFPLIAVVDLEAIKRISFKTKRHNFRFERRPIKGFSDDLMKLCTLTINHSSKRRRHREGRTRTFQMERLSTHY